MDTLSPSQRSANMRLIRSKDTAPELLVRRLCREAGYPGYRIHRKDIPGKPDIAFIGRNKAIFVHGCFWHGHNCKEGRRKPKSNIEYWLPKIRNNHTRDKKHIRKLKRLGWQVLIIWECQTNNPAKISNEISLFMRD